MFIFLLNHFPPPFRKELCAYWGKKDDFRQGCNAKKVISEVYTSFVLQCTVSGR